MANATLSRIDAHRHAAEHLREQASGGEGWKADYDDAMAARDIEDWVGGFLEFAGPAVALSRALHRRLRSNTLRFVEEVGRALDDALVAFTDLGQLIAGLVEVAEKAGYTIDREAEFRDARARVAKELDRLRRTWPRLDPARVAAARADLDAGRYQDTGALLRELSPGSDPG